MEIINVVGKYKQENRFWYERNVNTITKLTVHHTASLYSGKDSDILQSLYLGHVAQDWPGLSYHYIILKNGKIYQVNEHKWVTWHDGSNWNSIGICLHGFFHPQYNEQPTKEQLTSLKFLLDKLCTEHPEFPADHNDVQGHREVMATACPGNELFPLVQEYRNKLGNVDWGSGIIPPMDWKQNFKFDITKKLSDDIFKGLRFNDVAGLPRDTSLDSVWNFMQDQNDSIRELEAGTEKAKFLSKEEERSRISKLLDKNTSETQEGFREWKANIINTAIEAGSQATKREIAGKLGFNYESGDDIVEAINKWQVENSEPKNETITIADLLVRIFRKLRGVEI